MDSCRQMELNGLKPTLLILGSEDRKAFEVHVQNMSRHVLLQGEKIKPLRDYYNINGNKIEVIEVPQPNRFDLYGSLPTNKQLNYNSQ